jgi:RecB family exonuclease
VFRRKHLAVIDDSRAPAFAGKAVRGGTRVFADQAACPFRAFAHWRLGAAGLETPEAGLDAAQRGQLLHALMKHLWGVLGGSSSLQQDLAPAIEKSADLAVKELGLEGRFAELERARLARLAAEWLEIEKRRAPFEVVATEKPVAFQVAGIEFNGRIDRMDKVKGGHALIDYKTSRAPSPKHWEPPRPDDPQMPLYAVTAEEEIAAVAFAKLRPGDMKYMGFSKDDKAIEGVKRAKAWKPLLRAWRDEADALGGAFAAGEALVDPKRGLQTCRHCDLHTLCRVFEKINVLTESEDE